MEVVGAKFFTHFSVNITFNTVLQTKHTTVHSRQDVPNVPKNITPRLSETVFANKKGDIPTAVTPQR